MNRNRELIMIEEHTPLEEKMAALRAYKQGAVIGMYISLPHHTELDVLVTTDMGYYTLTGGFKVIRNRDHFVMLVKLVNVLNNVNMERTIKIKPGGLLKNLSLATSKRLLPYLENIHVPNSFRLIHIKREVYADPKTKEFVNVALGNRQSIYEGNFYTSLGIVHAIAWLRVVDPELIIVNKKSMRIQDYIESLYGKRVGFSVQSLKIYCDNGKVITLYNNGTVRAIKG